MTNPEWDVFISHASEDLAIAEELFTLLDLEVVTFLAKQRLVAGDDWTSEISRALRNSRLFLILISKSTSSATYQKEEIALAINATRRFPQRHHLFPVLLGTGAEPAPELPFGLETRQYIRLDLSETEALLGLASYVAAVCQDRNPAGGIGKTGTETYFSHAIRNNLTSINRHVDRLTRDQYRVIRQLRHLRRVRISGCAGSGKTLVAAEKASRLATAGSSVLFLCHNPLLADYVRDLISGSGVTVTDFASWVEHLANNDTSLISAWTNFHEPTTDSLGAAFDALNSRPGYDGVVVDEAQDFRDEWWVVVEAALRNPRDSFLYLFHDDHQALLPFRSSYPFEGPVIDLSRNCRNGGVIYETMRIFDSSAPDPEESLARQGYIKAFPFVSSDENNVLGRAFRWLQTMRLTGDSVVLLAGSESLSSTSLAGARITLPATHRWQDEVIRHFHAILHGPHRTGVRNPPDAASMVDRALSRLSQNAIPTRADIVEIVTLARSFFVQTDLRRRITTNPLFRKGFKWEGDITRFRLRRPGLAPIFAAELILHFERDDWSDGIPSGPELVLTPHFSTDGSRNDILMYDVAVYKGLESDGVILFLRGTSSKFAEELLCRNL